MSPFLIWGIRALTTLLSIKESGLADHLKAQIKELKEQFTPMLPPPPNGVEWTVADLQALADEHNRITAEIRARHGGG